MTLTKRITKGQALTHQELDDNFDHLGDGANIKAAYESEANTNAFTDAEKAKLANIEDGATTDPSGAEIVSSINSELGGATWQAGGSGGGTVDAIPNVTQDRLLGRISSGSGDSEELTAAQTRSLLNVEDGATANTGSLANSDFVGTNEISDQAVTLAKLANISNGRILGRDSGGSGDVEEMNAARVRNLLGVLTENTLQSNDSGDGASLIGIEDSAGNLVATTVETAIAELWDLIDDLDAATTSALALKAGFSDLVGVVDTAGAADTPRPNKDVVIWKGLKGLEPENAQANDLWDGYPPGVLQPFVTRSGAYTFASADQGKPVLATSGAAQTFTIDTDTNQQMEDRVTWQVIQRGTGALTIQAASGVNLNNVNGGSIAVDGQNKSVCLIRIAQDDWIAVGAYA